MNSFFETNKDSTVRKTNKPPEKVESKSTFFQPKLEVGPTDDMYEHEAAAVAEQVVRGNGASVQRKISTVDLQRKCAACEEEEKLQRKEKGESSENKNTPSVVNDVLSSSGKPMDKDTRSFMESKFGYDFSHVKIHSDSLSAKSADSINAHAFTSGNDIVFNESKYAPETTAGKRLLAHELTHVIQQTGTVQRKDDKEKDKKENDKKAKDICFDDKVAISENMKACPAGSTDVGRQPQANSNTKDAKAKAIIDAAKDTSAAKSSRAIQSVNDIICTYMPSSASKVIKIYYSPSDPGLQTQSVGSGSSSQGMLCVGDAFLDGISAMGRRALQVAHEIQHIDQYRSGMGGDNYKHEREFLAFYNEALDDEFIGTGRMNDGTRRSLIDAALEHYYCFNDKGKKTHESKLQELLTRRKTVNVDEPKDPPSDFCDPDKKDK